MGVCSSPVFATTLPLTCLASGGTAFTTTCDDNGGAPVQNDSCDVLNDVCAYAFDLVCDVGSLCPANSDCFDCDLFLEYRGLGCEICISNGGWYCETNLKFGICSSPDIAAAVPDICSDSGGSPYTSTCGDTPQEGTCDFANDPCVYVNDGACDAGVFCPNNSDCFDCSPCMDHRFEGCDACTAAGCLWCGADASCLPPGGEDFLPSSFQCTATDFATTCPATALNDPLYEASTWIFDLVKVPAVWAMGISTC